MSQIFDFKRQLPAQDFSSFTDAAVVPAVGASSAPDYTDLDEDEDGGADGQPILEEPLVVRFLEDTPVSKGVRLLHPFRQQKLLHLGIAWYFGDAFCNISPHHCAGFLFFALHPPLPRLRPRPRPPALPPPRHTALITAPLITSHLSHLTHHSTTHHTSLITAPLITSHSSHLTHQGTTHHTSLITAQLNTPLVTAQLAFTPRRACGRRSTQSLLAELVRAWAPLGRGWRRSTQRVLELLRAWAPLGCGWLLCRRRAFLGKVLWAGSHTIFDSSLCRTPSFTHHLLHTTLSHATFHTPSLSHHFVTYHLSHIIFHTTLSHTIFHTPSLTHHLLHTIFDTLHLSHRHRPSFTHHLSHPTLSNTIFDTPYFTLHFVTHHFVTPSSSHHLSPHHLSHTELCNTQSFLHLLLCLSFLPRPRYNISCSLLEEVDLWGYPVLLF